MRSKRASVAGFWLFALHLWTVLALAVSNVFLSLALLVSPWVAESWRRALEGRGRPLWAPLGLYALFLVVAIALSVEPAVSRPEIREIFVLSTLPLAFVFISDETSLRRLIDGVIVMAVVAAAWGLAQLFVGYGELSHRIVGPFSHYMTLSGVLMMADLALITQLVCSRRRRTAWRWAALVLINLALVATLTRSAWVALLTALIVLAVLHAPRALAVSLPALAVALLLAPSPVQQRFASIFDLRNPTNYDRLCMVEAGLRMVYERPIFGLGPETVKVRYPIYRQPTAPRRTVPHLHNSFVHLAAERGLASLAAYAWLMTAAAVTAFRGYRRERASAHGAAADLYLGAFTVILAFNVAGLFEANWRDTELQRLMLFFLAIPFLASAFTASSASADVRR